MYLHICEILIIYTFLQLNWWTLGWSPFLSLWWACEDGTHPQSTTLIYLLNIAQKTILHLFQGGNADYISTWRDLALKSSVLKRAWVDLQIFIISVFLLSELSDQRQLNVKRASCFWHWRRLIVLHFVEYFLWAHPCLKTWAAAEWMEEPQVHVENNILLYMVISCSFGRHGDLMTHRQYSVSVAVLYLCWWNFVDIVNGLFFCYAHAVCLSILQVYFLIPEHQLERTV